MLIAMKKAELYALKQDKEAILIALQQCGQFMICAPNEGGNDDAQELDAAAQKTLSSIKFVTKHQAKSPLLPNRPAVTFAQFLEENPSQQSIVDAAALVQSALSDASGALAGLTAQAQRLLPWQGFDVALEQIQPTQKVRFLMGYIPTPELQAAGQTLEACGVYMQTFGNAPEGTAVFGAYHADDAVAVNEALGSINFVEESFTKITGTAAQVIAKLQKDIELAQMQLQDLSLQAQELSKRKVEMQLMYERQIAMRDRAGTYAQSTDATFMLFGWVRNDQTEQINNALQSITDSYSLTFQDPAPEDEPPSVVQNNKVVAPFEFVTNLYSRPNPRSIDPNPLMAPFFFVFFGMMVSDAVYGIILGLGAFLFLKLFKPKGGMQQLVTVLLFGGISTFVWGALFGGWLGFELPALLFVPMTSPIPMLIMCFGFGLIQIFAGIIIKMSMLIKQGLWLDAIVDQLSWILLVGGLILLISPIAVVGGVLASIGGLMILFFGGRSSKNFGGRLIGGLGQLYGITSYLSDILSYSRLFALGLATGVIGMVINTLCGMVASSGIIGIVFAFIIMVGGHVFNLAINALGAYVHASRLQYIEYFSKFFESGGKEFKPLSVNPMYVDIV